MDQPDTAANESVPQPLTQKILLYWTLVGSLMFNVIYFSFGAISPNYDMMRQSISELELIPYGWIQSVNFVLFGLCVCGFAAFMHKELAGGFGADWIPLCQLLIALGLIMSGVFIHPPIHNAGCIIAYMAQLVSLLLFARRFAGDSRWKGWKNYSLITVTAMIVMLGLYLFARHRNGPYAGLPERMVIGVRLLWTVLLTINLLFGRRLTKV